MANQTTEIAGKLWIFSQEGTKEFNLTSALTKLFDTSSTSNGDTKNGHSMNVERMEMCQRLRT